MAVAPSNTIIMAASGAIVTDGNVSEEFYDLIYLFCCRRWWEREGGRVREQGGKGRGIYVPVYGQ